MKTQDNNTYGVVVMGLDWSIQFVPTDSPKLKIDGEDCYGVCNYNLLTLFIDESLPKAKMIQTIRHEFAHCYLYSHMISHKETFNEEELCEFVAIYGQEIMNHSNWIMSRYNEKC